MKRNKVFSWIAFGTGAVLLIPLVAMAFTDEVSWEVADFIIMGVLLFSMGSLFVLVSRRFPRRRIIIGAMFVALFLYLWAELAVGVFTTLGS